MTDLSAAPLRPLDPPHHHPAHPSVKRLTAVMLGCAVALGVGTLHCPRAATFAQSPLTPMGETRVADLLHQHTALRLGGRPLRPPVGHQDIRRRFPSLKASAVPPPAEVSVPGPPSNVLSRLPLHLLTLGLLGAAAALGALVKAFSRPSRPPLALAAIASGTSQAPMPEASSSPTCGLRSRNLHISQVPPSQGPVAQFRGVDLPQCVLAHTYAAAVVGGGPAGIALALSLARSGAAVVLLDNALGKDWPNNYGVWLDEWEPLGFPADTVKTRWDTTTVRYSETERTQLPRGYGRVDRKTTKRHLLEECVRSGVHFCSGVVTGIREGEGDGSSEIMLEGGATVLCKVPVVAAGHYSKLIKYHSPGERVVNSKGEFMTANWKELVDDSAETNPWGWQYQQGGAPGYQIAYGIEAETVKPHGFPVNEMVLMDWSGEWMQGHSKAKQWSKTPTFLYVMPTDETHVFLEETSLVGRPGLSIEECEERLQVRLKYMGIEVKSVEDVERCVIPMGGPLPVLGRRTVAYGASNNLVHPATGYMMNRAVSNASPLAAAIASTFAAGHGVDRVVEAAWEAVWPQEALRIRDFQVFGMEVILNMDLPQCQQFFRSFFRDPESLLWRQYLAVQVGSRECLEFALGLFANCSPAVKLRFMVDGVTRDGVSVLRSLLGL